MNFPFYFCFSERGGFDACWLDVREVEVVSCLLTSVATRHIRSYLQDTQAVK